VYAVGEKGTLQHTSLYSSKEEIGHHPEYPTLQLKRSVRSFASLTQQEAALRQEASASEDMLQAGAGEGSSSNGDGSMDNA
jgi:hypothetical protein